MRGLSGLVSNLQRRANNRAWLASVALISLNLAAVATLSADNYIRAHPDLCGVCHIMRDHVESYLTGDRMDNVHMRAGVGCLDCHTDYTLAREIASVWRYATGDHAPMLGGRTFDQAMCTRCHISLAYHADRTDYQVRNPHLSHWPDLACGDCHLSHADQIDFCSNCHDNGSQRLTGGLIAPRADNPWAGVDFSGESP